MTDDRPPKTNEAVFHRATWYVETALLWTTDMPHTPYRSWAKDNLQAALGWIQQAHDEWATREAEK